MFEDQIRVLPPQPPRDPELLPGLALSSSIPKKLILPLAYGALFALAPLFIIYNVSKTRLTTANSKTTDGEVVSVTDGAGNPSTRLILYTFVPPGAPPYRGSYRAGRSSSYIDVKMGDRVAVRYMVSNPAMNRLIDAADATMDPPFFVFFLFPIFGGIIIGSLVGPPIRELMKARRIFAAGHIRKGAVLFVKRRSVPSWPSGAPASAEIFITYRSTSGQEVEGRALCGNDWLIGLLPPGAPVTIAYEESNPGELILLEAYIR
jgi:hypothetical protein